MEQTIKINVPEGKVAKYNERTQTIEFIDKEPVISKSWEEFCKNHPYADNEWYFDSLSVIHRTGIKTHHRDRTDGYETPFLSSEEDTVGILALISLTRLHDEWVGDWKPSAKKGYYAITFDLMRNTLVSTQWWNTQHLLSFPFKEMSNEFLKCFEDLIKKAKKFL